MNFEQTKEKLHRAGQEHVLAYYEELTKEQKELLLSQIEDTDFGVLASVKDHKGGTARGKITPSHGAASDRSGA